MREFKNEDLEMFVCIYSSNLSHVVASNIYIKFQYIEEEYPFVEFNSVELDNFCLKIIEDKVREANEEDLIEEILVYTKKKLDVKLSFKAATKYFTSVVEEKISLTC